MKTRLLKYILPALVAISSVSCYNVEDAKLTELKPIELSVVSDTINVELGQKFVYEGLKVKDNANLSYSWVYGKIPSGKTASDHVFESKIFISDSPSIEYTFTKIGTFLLRLRLDNGESVVYKYFTLNVNAGYDEGIMILNNKEDGNSDLTFIKTLTSEEKSKGVKEVYTNIFSSDDKKLKNGTDLYLSSYKVKGVDYAGLLIATADEDGTLYHLQPKTMEMYAVNKFKEFNTSVKEFGGEYASPGGGFASYLKTEDGRIFRYDMQLGYLQEMEEFAPFGPMLRCVCLLNRKDPKSATTRGSIMFTENKICARPSAGVGVRTHENPGYNVVNMFCKRTGVSSAAAYAIFRNKQDKTLYMIENTSAAGSTIGHSWKKVVEFNSESLKMDSNSIFVGTMSSSDVYYTFDNAIYRWGLSGAPASSPAIKLPDGEIIRDIATNYMGKNVKEGSEDLLYVATYNPSRSGEKKGSLYIYRFSDNALVSSYEGLCYDPVSVLYKFRIN